MEKAFVYGMSVAGNNFTDRIEETKRIKADFEHGINVQPILHPAVEEKAARLRFFLSSEHSQAQMEFSIQTIQELTS